MKQVEYNSFEILVHFVVFGLLAGLRIRGEITGLRPQRKTEEKNELSSKPNKPGCGSYPQEKPP